MYFILGKKKTRTWALVLAVVLILRYLYFNTCRSLSRSISCHYANEGNSLPPAEDITPPPDSIFFLETSCKGGLSSRQACSVESAARLHPKSDVHVYFNSPVSKLVLNNSCLSQLIKFKNVKLARLHSVEYTNGTPLGEMLASRVNQWSDYPIEHTADLLRFVTLYKYGGVYLDTDTLVVKSLNGLGKNWSVRESDDVVAIGAMAFGQDETGRSLISKVLTAVKEDYRPGEWAHNGSGALIRALMSFCNTTDAYYMSADTCRGFQIYDAEVIYPVYFDNYQVYFVDNGKLPNNANTYAHHIWNHVTKDIEVQTGSLYEKLATKYCPSIRQLFGSRFGI